MNRRATLKLVAIDGDLVSAEEAPTVGPVAHIAANDPAPDAPGWGPRPEPVSDLRPAALAALPRRWRTLPALALSLAIHAVAIIAAAAVLTRAGSEAETDAIAVEIVFEAPPSIPAQPSPAEVAGTTPPEVTKPDETVTREEPAEIVLPQDRATAALLAEPPAIEPVEATADSETPAEAARPVDAAEISPPRDLAIEALLAEPPTVEPVDAPVEPAALDDVEAVDAERIELPTPDPSLAVLSVPPTFAEAPTTAPIAASTDTADAPLPDAVAMTPTPRPQATLPVANGKPTPPAEAKKPAGRKTAEASKAKTDTADVPNKTERAAGAKPGSSADKPAAQPTAKRPAKAESGSGAAAAAGANAGVEAAYGRKLLSHIERRKRYPAAARAAGVAGAVRLSVTIDRAGQLRSARVSKGSGHAVLDEEALATARRASPYPAPPDGVGGKTFSFSVTLRFSR